MTMTTARYRLPLIAPGQAQKEMFHNESLTAIDALLHPVVEGAGTIDPPPAPAIGNSWIVGAMPTGAWTGQAQSLATWTEGGWRFQAPAFGLRVTMRADRVPVEWDGTGWREGELRGARVSIGDVQVVGGRQAAIGGATGGTTIDVEARAALSAILAAMRAHGLIAQ